MADETEQRQKKAKNPEYDDPSSKKVRAAHLSSQLKLVDVRLSRRGKNDHRWLLLIVVATPG